MPIFENRFDFRLTSDIRLSSRTELNRAGLSETLSETLGEVRSLLKAAVLGKAAATMAAKKAHRALQQTGRRETGHELLPENLIWIFGAARTGSTWLYSMMKDLEGHAGWNEPLVGLLFGNLYYVQAARHVEKRGEDFILGQAYRDAWLRSIRSFLLNQAVARYPDVVGRDGYLVVKEPNGSLGAPLLMEALPQSRMVLLMRDPRDMVASMIEAQSRHGWLYEWSDGAVRKQKVHPEKDPVTFARMQATNYLRNMEKARQAYESHAGPKVLVRYEDLRMDTLKTMEHIYASINIPVGASDLARVVEKHSWENIPPEEKGAGKFNRKALPGAWREDLATEQAKAVEETAAQIIEEFYPGSSVSKGSTRAAKLTPTKPPTAEEVRRAISRVEHWYHQIEVAPGVVTPGSHHSKMALETLELPESMEGKRVLDVGARDGFFSFAAEARGAEVLAIDAVAREHLKGFDVASVLLGSNVEYRTANVYNLSPDRVGTFDAIFFLGVLYHLRDPMLALDRLWEVARPGATIWVESHTIDNGLVNPETGVLDALSIIAPGLEKIPIAQFYPRRTLGSNFTNWWGPNLAGLQAMVEASGFEIIRSRTIGSRGLVVATKVKDAETDFYRRFDRDEGTGEEGMSWDNKAKWTRPKFAWSEDRQSG